MIENTENISRINAIIATIAISATIGSIGAIGQQQQVALAQRENCTPIEVGPIGVRLCVFEEQIVEIGPLCEVIVLDPRLTPAFENFPFEDIVDICE